MSIEVVVRNILSDMWASDEDFSAMSDKEVIELVKEDMPSFLEESTIKVVRHEKEFENEY